MKTARFLVVVAFAFAACGSPTTSGGAGGNSSVPEGFEHAWRLIEGRGPDGEIQLVDNYEVTLEIKDRSAGGRAACNSYGGDIVIEGSSFRIADGGGVTQMACEEPGVMEAEAAYMSAYFAVDSIRREGDHLFLEGSDTFLEYEYVPPPPTAELVDTEWQLQSLLSGPGPEGTASSAAPATLLLSSDGQLSGSTGCRSFRGKWIINGGEIAVPEMEMLELHCPESGRDQDSHVGTVIGDGFTVEIDGQSLWVWDERGDLGMHYTSE